MHLSQHEGLQNKQHAKQLCVGLSSGPPEEDDKQLVGLAAIALAACHWAVGSFLAGKWGSLSKGWNRQASVAKKTCWGGDTSNENLRELCLALLPPALEWTLHLLTQRCRTPPQAAVG